MKEKKTKKKKRRGFGLIRNFGWKKNLLATATGFVVCLLLDNVMGITSNFRIFGSFDISIAVMPLLGFLLAGWGVLGCILENLIIILLVELSGEITYRSFLLTYYVMRGAAMILYCALPSILWYAIPLRREEEVKYPRMDTSGHVIKYYLIMLFSVSVYVTLILMSWDPSLKYITYLDVVVSFSQYLDVALIVGLPLLILVSVLHNKTVTINERMVLGFLTVGVLASVLGGVMVYQSVMKLDPDVLTAYESLMELDEEIMTYDDEEMAVIENYYLFWNWLYVAIAVMLNSLLIIEMLLMRRIEKRVTRPIIRLADILEEYTKHEENSFDSETVISRCEPYRRGFGEVSSLTSTCVNMVGEIDSYTENLRQVTAEKERIGAELDVASKIQKDMLPGVFPPFPDRNEMELFASMTPAKEVGGDFYDFYLIDRDHLALTIADVTGKGVPAALFMVISKTLLNNNAQACISPKEILTYTNHQLCQNNDSLMFCTVWLGILSLSTGKLVAANAGHEYPAVKRSGGQFELHRDRHDPPIGFRDGIRYHEYETTLYPGDCLFEYTDGVTEATSAAEELFGEERLVEALNADPEAGPEELIGRVSEAIRLFVGNAPQFDDTTMLCIRYLGSDSRREKKQVVLEVPAKVNRLDEVTAFTEEQLGAVGCPSDALTELTLAVEEIFVNVANYAYEGGEGSMTIAFSFDNDSRIAEFVFTDSGIPFDPLARPDPDITKKPKDRQIGGLGIFIVKKTMDEVHYEYAGGHNILTIRKQIPSENT